MLPFTSPMVYVKAGKKVAELNDDVLENLGNLSRNIDKYKEKREQEQDDDDYGGSITNPVHFANAYH